VVGLLEVKREGFVEGVEEKERGECFEKAGDGYGGGDARGAMRDALGMSCVTEEERALGAMEGGVEHPQLFVEAFGLLVDVAGGDEVVMTARDKDDGEGESFDGGEGEELDLVEALGREGGLLFEEEGLEEMADASGFAGFFVEVRA
jgi:hypothetical protein